MFHNTRTPPIRLNTRYKPGDLVIAAVRMGNDSLKTITARVVGHNSYGFPKVEYWGHTQGRGWFLIKPRTLRPPEGITGKARRAQRDEWNDIAASVARKGGA